MNLFLIFLVLAAGLVLAWNFIPAFRERMRGLTTVAEGAIAAVTPFVGELIDAFQDTDWKGFIPNGYWPYILAGLAGWFIFKRLVTRTPVGKAT